MRASSISYGRALAIATHGFAVAHSAGHITVYGSPYELNPEHRAGETPKAHRTGRAGRSPDGSVT
jgi:hypothetical protein